MAALPASFKIETFSISYGLILVSVLELEINPSITIRGSLFPVVLTPRILILKLLSFGFILFC